MKGPEDAATWRGVAKKMPKAPGKTRVVWKLHPKQTGTRIYLPCTYPLTLPSRCTCFTGRQQEDVLQL